MTAFPNCFCPSPSPTVLRFLFIASCSLNLIQYTVRYWHERQSLPNWLAIIFHLFWHPFFFFFLSLLALMAVCFYPLFFLLSPSLKFDILSDICPLVTHAPPCSWSRLGQIHLKVSSVCVCVCSTLLLSVGWKCAPQE